MEKQMLKEKVIEILSNVMDIDSKKIYEHSSPNSIENWDSLSHMNLIISLEEEFKVQFTDEQIVKMTDLKSIVSFLKELLKHHEN